MSEEGDIFSDPIVEQSKIKYLLQLSRKNSYTDSKVQFFDSFGFSMENPSQFVDAIKSHPVTAQLNGKPLSIWGQRFVFVCNIDTPSGKSVCIKSVWQVDVGQVRPRLITAYPQKTE